MFTKLCITECMNIQVVHQLLLKLLSLHPKTACFDIGSVSHPLHVFVLCSPQLKHDFIAMYHHDLHKSTHVLPSNWIMCYSMIHSDAPHCSMVYYETNETSSRSCIALYASAKKVLRENLKMGKEWRGLFLFERLPIYFVPPFSFCMFSLPFLYMILCVQFSFWGHSSNR